MKGLSLAPLSSGQCCELALVGAEGLKDGIGEAALEDADRLSAAVAVTSAPLNHGLGVWMPASLGERDPVQCSVELRLPCTNTGKLPDRASGPLRDWIWLTVTSAPPSRTGVWVADLTYIKTLQGILYLAVVLDVFSRKVVGWQMADRMTTDLVLTAFEMGLWRREVVQDQLIHHSDKGSQYTSLRFTQRLADASVAPSTGSVGDSYDNAVAESFFGSLKTELIYRHTWISRHDAELAIFAWIEGWHNPERIMAGLAMRSPDEYEAAFYADTQNTNSETLIKVGNPESSLQ